jgi:transcriptional regulator with XRE-family HTH domain
MAALNAGKIIRKVRGRLELSQEGLSRLMNSTKGAVQHWERGRNIPSLGRLWALRQLCPPSPDRKDLDALIRDIQTLSGPITSSHPGPAPKGARILRAIQSPAVYPGQGLKVLQRENDRLHRQVAMLESTLNRRDERLRILENLATDLQREMAQMRAKL